MGAPLLDCDYQLVAGGRSYFLPDDPVRRRPSYGTTTMYIWLEFDVAPHFPALNKFLCFREDNVERRRRAVHLEVVPVFETVR
jgi:uncharacterized protein Usg